MNRKGFTLIELLIVVVIIGILAAIAIPKFANTKEKAYLASMKSDLRNLITAEEAYFADSVKYTSNLGTAYNTTSGVVGPTIVVTADGFTATVTHTTTTKTCAVYVGSTAPAPPRKGGGARGWEGGGPAEGGGRVFPPPLFFWGGEVRKRRIASIYDEL